MSDALARAFALANELHGSQRRKGSGVPYVSHLLGVCSIVLENGGSETEAIAALLHDAAEDQGGLPMVGRIRKEFGREVARIVTECSDTFEQPKPPWRERKERYLAGLSAASPSALLVSVADKLHNARSILADYRAIGPEVWTRFHPDSDQLWYYRSLVATYRKIGWVDGALVDELDRVVTELEAVARP